MSKRAANDAQEGQPFQKTGASGSKRELQPLNEMGEFEDAWEDEIEEEEVVNESAENDEDGMLVSGRPSFHSQFSS